MTNDLRPASITRTEDGGVHAREFVKVGDEWAVDADRGYRPIGYITELRRRSMGKRKNVSEWYATTPVDTRLGPFKTRVAAVSALAEWNGLRPMDSRLTIPYLF